MIGRKESDDMLTNPNLFSRERTLQNRLRMYEQMYADLKSE